MKRRMDGRTDRQTDRSVTILSRSIIHTMSSHWILINSLNTAGARGSRWCYISKEGWTFIRDRGEGKRRGRRKLNIWLAPGASSIWSDWKWVQTPGMIEERTLHYSVGMPNSVVWDTAAAIGIYCIYRSTYIITGPNILASKFRHILCNHNWPRTVCS